MKVIHGGSRRGRRDQEYGIWAGMKARCYCKTNKAYPYYGGRTPPITVCDEWRNSYPTFLSDMGRRPSSRHSIHRIDNDKGYERGNVEWALSKKQNRYRRNVKPLTLAGVTRPIPEWAEIKGISRKLIYDRDRKGYSAEDALNPTVDPLNKRSHPPGKRLSVKKKPSKKYPSARAIPGLKVTVGYRHEGSLLEAISDAGMQPKGSKPTPRVKHWRCRCDCGHEEDIQEYLLKTGKKSCGCLWDEVKKKIGKLNFSHGQSCRGEITPTYGVYRKAMQACYNLNDKSYERYGGRGIGVWEGWRGHPDLFVKYVEENLGPRPSPKHSLGRKDVNKDYEPDNLQWADRKTQARNKRKTLMVLINGKTEKFSDQVEAGSVPYGTAWTRVYKLGWSPEEALFTK